MKDRVLGANGTFEPFPERLEAQAIKQGVKDAPADIGEPEPLLNSNALAKRELALKMIEDAKIQAEMDMLIKERAVKKALEEKEFESAKANDAIKAAADNASAKAKKL